MKSLIDRISESSKFDYKKGSSFTEKVKYSKEDWNKWLDYFYNGMSDKHIMLGNDPDSGMILVYIKNGEKLNHIASYNPKTTVLYTDDIKLFGHEK